MGQFNGMKLTNKGQTLQAKAQAGTMLQFTRLAIGDGNLGSTDPLTLNALISQKKSLQVKKLESLTGGKAVVGSSFTNADVTTGFDMRELGVFAQDPDVGEILYMYGNAGNTADFIPPGSGGGSDVLERALNVVTIVGTAANVTAVIDQSLVFATAAQLGDLSTLKTSAKGSTVAAINELFQSASDGKSAVAAAVTGKGVAASSSDTFATLSTKIGNISKDATAAPGDVLAGKTYYKDLKQTGTMPNRGTAYVSPSSSQQTLPAGYYSSIVTYAVSFDPSKLLSGTSVAGTGGTMPSRGTDMASLGHGQNYRGNVFAIPPVGYYQGNANSSVEIPWAWRPSVTSATSQGIYGNNLYFRFPQGVYQQESGASGMSEVYATSNDWTEGNIVSGANVFGKIGNMRPWNGEHRYGSGVVNSSGDSQSFPIKRYSGDNNGYFPYVSISGLGFLPSLVLIKAVSTDDNAGFTLFSADYFNQANYTGGNMVMTLNNSGSSVEIYVGPSYASPGSMTDQLIRMPVRFANKQYRWFAVE